MLKIFKYLKKSTLAIIVIIALLFMQAMCELALPEYTAKIVNVGITEGKGIPYIILSGTQMLGLALGSMIAAILVTLISSRVAAKLARELRTRIFKKVVNFSNKEFEQFSTASLITRTTNDIQQIQLSMTMLFRIVVYSPILAIGGFIKVFNTSSEMEWVLGVAVICILILVAVLFTMAMPKFKKMQSLIDRLNLVTREILTGLPVIRAFANQKYEEKRFDKANIDLTKVNSFVNKAMSFMMPTMMFIMNGISVLIVWVGSKNVNLGNLQVGDMMAFIQYTMQIIMSFLMISMISIMLPRSSVSAKRILEVLNTKSTIKDPENPKKFDRKYQRLYGI